MELGEQLQGLLRAGAAGGDLAVPRPLVEQAVDHCAELQQAREEALMKPSVARKLNERIRSLESELDLLRSNKKVLELEKKVQFLEAELRSSYSTKNFTLKNALLELEKKYRTAIDGDATMAALWADVAALLVEEKKELPRMASVGSGGAPQLARCSSGPRGSESSGGDAPSTPIPTAPPPPPPPLPASLATPPPPAAVAAASTPFAVGFHAGTASPPAAAAVAAFAAAPCAPATPAPSAAAPGAVSASTSASTAGGSASGEDEEPLDPAIAPVHSKVHLLESRVSGRAGSGPMAPPPPPPPLPVLRSRPRVTDASANPGTPVGPRLRAEADTRQSVPALLALFEDFISDLQVQGVYEPVTTGSVWTPPKPCSSSGTPSSPAGSTASSSAGGPAAHGLASVPIAAVPAGAASASTAAASDSGRGTAAAAGGPAPADLMVHLQRFLAADPAQLTRLLTALAAGGADAQTPAAAAAAAAAPPVAPATPPPAPKPRTAEVAVQADIQLPSVPGTPPLGEGAASNSAAAASAAGPAPSDAAAEAAAAAIPAAKAVLGQTLEVLSDLEARGLVPSQAVTEAAACGGDGEGAAAGGVLGGVESLSMDVIRPDELGGLEAAAKEINALRASSMQLAAQLSVSQSLIGHLNGAMRSAVERADDGDAAMGELSKQLEEARKQLGSMSSEQSELTRLLIDAKVDIAESKGQLLRVVRDLRRALQKEVPITAKVAELEAILAYALPDEPAAAPAASASARR